MLIDIPVWEGTRRHPMIHGCRVVELEALKVEVVREAGEANGNLTDALADSRLIGCDGDM